jgi:hypothetical protein
MGIREIVDEHERKRTRLPGEANVIVAPDGRVINRSRNLAGIRKYVGSHLVKKIVLEQGGGDAFTGGGTLHVYFDDGAEFHGGFASYSVMENFVDRWRNVKGVPIEREGVQLPPGTRRA